MEYTGQMKVMLASPKYQSLDELQELVEAGHIDKAMQYAHCTAQDMSHHGWVEIGTATVTVKLNPPEAVVGKQLEALQAELKNERAEAQMRQNAILDRISKLQALTT